MARDRPSPYEEGDRFSLETSGYRSAGACPPRTFGGPQRGEGQALALRWEEGVLGDVARGPRMPHAHPSGFPPRSFGRPQHGEGQALALRGKGMFFSNLLSIATIFGQRYNPCNTSKKCGNVLLTHPGLQILTPGAFNPISENAIATR